MNVHKIISKSSYKNDEAHTEMINPTSYNDAGADTPKQKNQHHGATKMTSKTNKEVPGR